MKFKSKLVWFLLAPSIAAVACAAGSEAGDTSDLQPRKESKPTEPPPEHVTIPEPKPEPPEPVDAGDAASPVHVRPDASACANLGAGDECAVDPQCGCDTGETCDVIDRETGKAACIAAGTKALGATCVTPTQCAQGLTCVDDVCRPLCAKNKTTCTGENLGVCKTFQDSSGKVVEAANICTITCDLATPGAVCGENNCLWKASVKATDCHPAGTRKAHEGCSRLSDCAPGLTCVVVNQFKVECEPWCRTDHREDCAAPKFCNDVYGANAPVVDGSKLGHCQ